MEQTDEIDILLTLNPNGWSICSFFFRDKTFECTITHIFGDPYVDLIHALSALVSGQNNITFFWYSEPGGYRINIERIATQQHKVVVTIDDFGEVFDEEPKVFELQLEFEVKLKQLITLFYFQLYKTHSLLQDKQYASKRVNSFPLAAFNQFDKLIRSYMSV